MMVKYSIKPCHNLALLNSIQNSQEIAKRVIHWNEEKPFSNTVKYYTTLSDKNNSNRNSEKEDKFNQWLAGIIDGDGCFLLSKKGYASLEIVTQLRDKRCLYLIKQKYGGAVKLYAGDNYLRYRLHHKAGLLNLIKGVNGLIRNPIRILQLGKICNKYGINLKDTQALTYYNGWLAGFFDSDGSIYLNDKSGQIYITATQKNRFILDALVELYGGQISSLIKQNTFVWICNKKSEILPLINNYFKVNACRSEKLVRLTMVNKFYELKGLQANTASPNSDLGKAWKHFLVKWDCFKDKEGYLYRNMVDKDMIPFHSIENNIPRKNNRNTLFSKSVRLYSTNARHEQIKSSLNPLWVTGFADGESSFTVSIRRNKKYTTGWNIELCFQFCLHQKDKALLEQIQNYFGVGNIYNHGPNSIQFRVQSIKDLAVIINHFEKYPLNTKKLSDYLLFKMVFKLILNKEHLTQEGLRNIVSIKASLNKGLSEELKVAFEHNIPILRPLIQNQKVSDHNWLGGFITAEGCFFIRLLKSESHKLKERVTLIFMLTQHSRDEVLMRSLVDYLGCGNIYISKNTINYRVEKHLDIEGKLIPHLNKCNILGEKSLDFKDWREAVKLIQNKDHLTKNGLEQIRKIQSGMNRAR